jgi:hypothetical protein
MRTLLGLATLVMSFTTHAAPLPAIPLYEKGAADALGTADRDIPTLTAYLPQGAAQPTTAILICPGGGYGGLADHEGAGYATWL